MLSAGNSYPANSIIRESLFFSKEEKCETWIQTFLSLPTKYKEDGRPNGISMLAKVVRGQIRDHDLVQRDILSILLGCMLVLQLV